MATFFNGVGYAILVAYIIAPYVRDDAIGLIVADASIGLALAILLHVMGQVVLTFQTSKDGEWIRAC